MTDLQDPAHRKLLGRLQWTVRAGRVSLLAERAGAAFWPPAFWAAGFCGLWLTDLPRLFGEAGLYAANVLFLAGFAVLLWRAAGRFRLPSHSEILRRIESESGLENRPLASISDRLVNSEGEPARILWKARWGGILTALKRLRVPVPAPLISAQDPRALRILAALLLVCGIVIAGPRWPERLADGLFPYASALRSHAAETVALWVTPPAYTGAGQMSFTGADSPGEPVAIPAGSKVKARVSGGLGTPYLIMGETSLPLADLGGGSWGIEADIAPGKHLTIRQTMFSRASIPYSFVRDEPPTIALKGEPETLERGQIQIPVTVRDDYGVRDLHMSMTLDPMIEDAPMGKAVEDTRAVMSPGSAETELKPVYDLTAHPWAGLPVVLALRATDGTGQSALAPELRMTLPERQFRHPVAKQLIAQRKKLIWSPVPSAAEVSGELETILAEPAAYNGDIVVFLALRTASSRLFHAQTDESASAVVSLLWDTALRVEDGNLTLAARNLRQAQRNLQKALDDPKATPQDIARLTDELQDALAEYFSELQREMQKRMAEGHKIPVLPPEMMAQAIDPQMLSEFLEQMQQQALSGDRDAAREMLSQLQKMMDMMDPSMAAPMPPDMQFMSEGINELQELIDKQQQLLDRTREMPGSSPQRQPQTYGEALPPDLDALREWNLESMPPLPRPQGRTENVKPNADAQARRTEQEALRFILGQLMREAGEVLDEIPENMGLAEQDMRGSSGRLGLGDTAGSIPHQQQAIENLQKAAQQMSQQMAQRLQQMTGMAFGMGRTDPLGRPMREDENLPPGLFGGRVKIPDEAERKRVEDILRLLRQRSGEIDRPEEELDYFRRLLRQF